MEVDASHTPESTRHAQCLRSNGCRADTFQCKSMCVLRLDEAVQLCPSSDTECAGKEIKSKEKMKHLVNSEFKKIPCLQNRPGLTGPKGLAKRSYKDSVIKIK